MVNDPLLQQLVSAGKMAEDAAEAAQKAALEAQQSTEDYLAANNLVGVEDLTEARGKLYNIPYIDLTGKKIEPEVLQLIPEETASHYKVIAFQKSDKEVNVGIVDPRNFKALEAVEFLMKEQDLQPFYYIISEPNYAAMLKSYKGLGEEVSQVLEVAKEKLQAEEEEEDIEIEGDIQEVIKRAPVSKIVSIIIKHAVDSRASDIHIEPEKEQSRVRYRIDGIMIESLQLPIYLHNSVVTRIKVLADLQLDETRKPQDGRIRLKLGKNEVSLRISTLPLIGTEKVVMRVLDTSGKVPQLGELGYAERNQKLIEDSMHRSNGMVLVTGPTGSGKSTTLYSVLNILNEASVNIVTLEDPAEFYIPGVNQSQVNPDVGFTFASGLRSILRQDPDIIMVGEVRDRETAELAVNAALTGHLMFSTLHTSNAIGAMPRLIDMGLEPYLLSATLAAAIAQRLVRTICEHCKVDITLPEELEAQVRESLGRLPKKYQPKEIKDKKPLVFYKGNGCVRCNDTGYKGRTSIAEVIVIEDDIKQIIAEGADTRRLEEAAIASGVVFMQQDGFLRALDGVTTVEEVLRVMQE
jgi:type IV pilus assembly protein PilB